LFKTSLTLFCIDIPFCDIIWIKVQSETTSQIDKRAGPVNVNSVNVT